LLNDNQEAAGAVSPSQPQQAVDERPIRRRGLNEASQGVNQKAGSRLTRKAMASPSAYIELDCRCASANGRLDTSIVAGGGGKVTLLLVFGTIIVTTVPTVAKFTVRENTEIDAKFVDNFADNRGHGEPVM
jgi:hypothetical protein